MRIVQGSERKASESSDAFFTHLETEHESLTDLVTARCSLSPFGPMTGRIDDCDRSVAVWLGFENPIWRVERLLR
jgi:hypothetical protein